VGDVGAAYAGCRQRIGVLVEGLDEAGSVALVPTCPAWTVHDVVAHVAGVVDDALAGRLDGVATEPWTAAQVDARRGHPVAEIVAEWNEAAPAFEGLLDQIGPSGRQAVLDVVTHEHDIRTALGAAGHRESDAVDIGLSFVAPRWVEVAAESGLAVGVEAATGARWGAEDAPLVLSGTPFELVRALTGRRSVDQLRALGWRGDCEPAIESFTYGPFHPAAHAIAE
jgi:uncharacterized protein (TIGR03083 family)